VSLPSFAILRAHRVLSLGSAYFWPVSNGRAIRPTEPGSDASACSPPSYS
jgi:hypothetical protein